MNKSHVLLTLFDLAMHTTCDDYHDLMTMISRAGKLCLHTDAEQANFNPPEQWLSMCGVEYSRDMTGGARTFFFYLHQSVTLLTMNNKKCK